MADLVLLNRSDASLQSHFAGVERHMKALPTYVRGVKWTKEAWIFIIIVSVITVLLFPLSKGELISSQLAGSFLATVARWGSAIATVVVATVTHQQQALASSLPPPPPSSYSPAAPQAGLQTTFDFTPIR